MKGGRQASTSGEGHFAVAALQVDRVDADGRPALEALGAVLQPQHAARADVGAQAAADAGRALHVLVGHGVGADVDAHLAVSGAVPAGDAHVLLDRDRRRPNFWTRPRIGQWAGRGRVDAQAGDALQREPPGPTTAMPEKAREVEVSEEL